MGVPVGRRLGTLHGAMAETIELHVVSDATGETATRVVLAVERQFPDLEF